MANGTEHKSSSSSRKHVGKHKHQQNLEPSLRDYVEILYRWKYVIIGVTIATFIGVTLYTFLGKFIYEATTIVQVGSKPNSGMAFPSFDISALSSNRNLMKEIGILKSRTIAEEVVVKLKEKPVATLGGTDTLEFLRRTGNEPEISRFAHDEEILARLEGSVTFEPNNASDVIYIYSQSTDPKESAVIANLYAHAYYENNLNASRKQLRTAREFLETTLENKKNLLDVVEDSLRQHMEEYGAIDVQSQSILSSISSLDARRDEVDIDIQTTQSLIATYQKRVTEIKASLPKNAEESVDSDSRRMLDLITNIEVQKLYEQIASLEAQRDIIKEQNTNERDQNLVAQKINELDKQITELRKKMNQKIGASSTTQKKTIEKLDDVKDLTSKILEAQIRLSSFEVKRKALEASILQNEEKLKTVPRINIEYARLQRTKMSLEKVYIVIEERYQGALVAEQSQFGYVEILQFAVPPTTFISPNISKNLSFGFIVGLVLGISIAFLINNFDDRIHKPEDVKKLGLTVLTVVPAMDDQIHNIKGTMYSAASINGERGTVRREVLEDETLVEDTINPTLITAINPYSRIADSYRRLRTSIQYWKQDTPLTSVLVTSGAPQEGKSLTSSNLAVVFAQTKKKVLLVDVDLRRPSIQGLFNLELEPGLTEVLFGEADLASVIRPTFVENLDILTCGSIPLNPAELINSPAMKILKQELGKIYDIVIYDSPPILLFTDAELLVSMVDAVVFVVKSESTKLDNLEHAVDLIEGIKMNLTGVVVNNYVLNRLHRGYYHLQGDYYYTQRYVPHEKS